jgi:hypothetical protein
LTDGYVAGGDDGATNVAPVGDERRHEVTSAGKSREVYSLPAEGGFQGVQRAYLPTSPASEFLAGFGVATIAGKA